MRNCFSVLFSLAPLLAGAVVGTAARAAPIVGGGVWSAVGQINEGSAVAIGPHAVLTAGHVGGGDFRLNGSTYHMTSTALAPVVKGSATDLRVVFVSETLPSWYAVGTSVKSGASVTMVGYGTGGVLNATATGYELNDDAMLRSATNKLSSKGTTAGHGPTMLTLLKAAGNGALTAGDSGGGWFAGGKLVGISDFTFNNKPALANYGFNKKKPYFGSGAIDLTNKSLQSWLKNGMPASSGVATAFGRGQARIVPVPEPGTLATLALGAALLRRGRKKR